MTEVSHERGELTARGKSGLGLVETHYVELFQEGLELESGVRFGPITVAYETYGELSPRRDNVILVCHALSGGAHAAGWLPGQKKPGWWDIMIGPGKAFDTNKYFVICSNVLGSCYGTTGPSSLDPKTGKPYGLTFPVVTIRDMVNVQARLLDYLGIARVLCVTGGSMGGMQALQWAVAYPERVRSVVAIATTWRHSAQQIAFNEVARQAIMADPAWNRGDYYGTEGPRMGLAVARMIGHITYLSDVSMERKFGRRLRNRERYGFDFTSIDFEVESYLRYQGQSFVERFDANSLLYLTKALDYFDVTQGTGALTDAFAGSKSLFLFITFSSDWLYPPQQLKEVAQAVRRAGGDATYCEINSDYGHDAFLLEHAAQAPLIASFLQRASEHQFEGDSGEGI
ncbi:MAG: homoserine O-acetyltransferase [Candidatus Sumerlaeaceae bacterium]|nr:homoserine O-acetyltransferase [Candidatus Sumerlaeaceae bacterium]